MPCGATQDRRVMVERSDRMWSTVGRNGKPLQYSCLENPMNSMRRQNDRILKEELPRSVGAQHATRDQCRNNSRKNEGMEPKQKQHPVVDVCQGMFDGRIPPCCLSWVLCPSSSGTACCSQGQEVIVWGKLGSPLVNIPFRTKLLSLIPLSWDMDCLLTLWLTLPLVPSVTVAVHLVFWSLSFPKEVSCTVAYIYS